MKIKNSELMAKLAQHKHTPIELVGYPVKDESGLRLYPRLDPAKYYGIDEKCVLEVVPIAGSDDGIVRMYLDVDCEIEFVVVRHVKACDINRWDSRCGCHDKPTDDAPTAQLQKERIRGAILRLAKALVAMGITEFNCGNAALSGMTVACCRAWNKLLGAVNEGADTFEPSQEVLAACEAIG